MSLGTDGQFNGVSSGETVPAARRFAYWVMVFVFAAAIVVSLRLGDFANRGWDETGTTPWNAILGTTLIAFTFGSCRAIELALVRWSLASRTRIPSRFFAGWGVSLTVFLLISVSWFSLALSKTTPWSSLGLLPALAMMGLLSFPVATAAQAILQFAILRRSRGLPTTHSVVSQGRSTPWLSLISIALIWLLLAWLIDRIEPYFHIVEVYYRIDYETKPVPISLLAKGIFVFWTLSFVLELAAIEGALAFLLRRKWRWWSVLLLVPVSLFSLGSFLASTNSGPFDLTQPASISPYWGLIASSAIFLWCSLWLWGALPDLRLNHPTSDSPDKPTKSTGSPNFSLETSVILAPLVGSAILLFHLTGSMTRIGLEVLGETRDVDAVRRLWRYTTDEHKHDFLYAASSMRRLRSAEDRAAAYQLVFETVHSTELSDRVRMDAISVATMTASRLDEWVQLWIGDGETSRLMRRSVDARSMLNRLNHEEYARLRAQIVDYISRSDDSQLLLDLASQWKTLTVEDLTPSILAALLRCPCETLRMLAANEVAHRRIVALYPDLPAAVGRGFEEGVDCRIPEQSWLWDWEDVLVNDAEAREALLAALLHPDHPDGIGEFRRVEEVLFCLVCHWVSWRDVIEQEPQFLTRFVRWQLVQPPEDSARIAAWMLHTSCFDFEEYSAALNSLGTSSTIDYVEAVEQEMMRPRPPGSQLIQEMVDRSKL
ncbi:MAG: hypothetical protein KDA83_05165 [Planctomycetales bacterium]|nr:hypothetical protein [Planctomycetales bacterium]